MQVRGVRRCVNFDQTKTGILLLAMLLSVCPVVAKAQELNENQTDAIKMAAQCVLAANAVHAVAKKKGQGEDSTDYLVNAAFLSIADIPNREEVLGRYKQYFNEMAELTNKFDDEKKLEIFGPVFFACDADYRGKFF